MKHVSEPMKINEINYVWITEEDGDSANQCMMTEEKYTKMLIDEIIDKHRMAWEKLARS
jgi:hypothetical protein